MDVFLEKLRPNVDLKIDQLIVKPEKKEKSNLFTMSDSSFTETNRQLISRQICSTKLEKQTVDSLGFVYIPMENRGFPIKDLLTKYLNLNTGEIHPLPWDLPYCQQMDWRFFNQTLLGELTENWASSGLKVNSIVMSSGNF